MLNSTPTRRLTSAALLVALGVLLPQLFHAIPNFGTVFSPMHLPVLACGLICGWKYGLLCGLLTPALSSALTAMPPAMILPGMVCELAVYGLVGGLLFARIKTGKRLADIYLALIPAMLLGRLFAGLMNGLFFRAGDFTLQMFLTGYFVTSLPGILLHLVLIPILMLALEKAKVIQYAV